MFFEFGLQEAENEGEHANRSAGEHSVGGGLHRRLATSGAAQQGCS